MRVLRVVMIPRRFVLSLNTIRYKALLLMMPAGDASVRSLAPVVLYPMIESLMLHDCVSRNPRKQNRFRRGGIDVDRLDPVGGGCDRRHPVVPGRRELRVVLIPRPCAGVTGTTALFPERGTTMATAPRQGFPRAALLLPSSLLFLFIAFTPALAVEAMQTVGFSDAVSRALQRNAAVTAAGFDLEVAKRDVQIALASNLPSLTFEEKFVRSSAPAEVFGLKMNRQMLTAEDFADPVARFNNPAPLSDFITAVSVEQPIFAPRAILGYRMAEREAGARASDTARTKEETVYRVVSAYLGVLTAKEFVGVTGVALEAARQHYELAGKIERAGLGLCFRRAAGAGCGGRGRGGVGDGDEPAGTCPQGPVAFDGGKRRSVDRCRGRPAADASGRDARRADRAGAVGAYRPGRHRPGTGEKRRIRRRPGENRLPSHGRRSVPATRSTEKTR